MSVSAKSQASLYNAGCKEEYDHYYIIFFFNLQGEYCVNVAPAYWPHKYNFLHLCASLAFAKVASSGEQLPYFLNIEMLT